MALNYRDKGSYIERITPASERPDLGPPPYVGYGSARLPDGDWLDLPFLPLQPDFAAAIAYLAINQNSFEVEDRLSTAMADLVRPLEPEIVVGMPTLGMVLAAPVAKKLGHERYVPLGYSRKFWYEDELSVDVISVTSPLKPKQVFIDPRLIERLEGKRVLLVEDVISTGGTIAGELQLMKKLGANVVGVACAIKETRVWQETLGAIDPAYPALVHAPVRFPLYRKIEGGWAPDMTTMPD